jgi:hypothetical protein
VSGIGDQRQTTGAKAGKELEADEQERGDERPSQNVSSPVMMVMMAGTVVMMMRQKDLPLLLFYRRAALGCSCRVGTQVAAIRRR